MEEKNNNVEQQLREITRTFLVELQREELARGVTLDADLLEDLGIDSLGRVELFHRVEKAFDIQLPDYVMSEARLLRDLILPIQLANPPQQQDTQQRKQQHTSASVDVSRAETLVEVLSRYAHEVPNRPHIYLQHESGDEQIIRYGTLYEDATRVSHGLISCGIKPGDTVSIMLPTSEAFFQAFFGILIAGAVPVPIYPPFRPDQLEDYVNREGEILSNAEVRILITFQRAQTLSGFLQARIPDLKRVTTVAHLMSLSGKQQDIELCADDPALIQYTSGSTSSPKGVLLTHQNLLSNIRAIGEALGLRPTDAVVSWLPLYHDMGLIGTWLGSLYHGIPITIMSPLSFLSRPERWLWAMHYHRATISVAPNFAYGLCVGKVDDSRIEGLDLSAWRIAMNGAETIYPTTLSSFIERYAAYGFDEKALVPVYGLAESTVGLLVPKQFDGPKIDWVDRIAFEEKQFAEPTKESANNTLSFICVGSPLPGHEVRIVNEEGQTLTDRQVGQLEFKGPSTMQGYYRNPTATANTLSYGWLNSGDLAYQVDGEFFIAGRVKDLIIKGGRNFPPDELEQIAATVPGVRKGCVVAFGVSDATTGTEKTILVAETHIKDNQAQKKLSAEIIEKIAAISGFPPDQVILAPPKTIQKTSSGKLRRATCKAQYLEGSLKAKKAPIWRQVTKLFLTTHLKKVLQAGKQVLRLIYTGYLGLLGLVILLPALAALYLLPTKQAAACCRRLSRLLLIFAGCRIVLQGREHLSEKSPCIYAANHASFIDSVVLLAILPTNTAFVGKLEIQDMPLIKLFIKKLQHLTVDRLDFSKSYSDIQTIESMLHSGRSIAIFPEGTFTYATGLRPFKMGAFKIAADTQLPICPVALNGTRKILRGEEKTLWPGKIVVTASKPLLPQGSDWETMTQLHTQVYQAIAKHCGEPSINRLTPGLPTP